METIANPYQQLSSQLVKLSNQVEDIQDHLKHFDPSSRSLVTREVFQSKYGMSDSDFYKKAPKGMVPGALKYGAKWFVDLDIFEKEVKKQGLKSIEA